MELKRLKTKNKSVAAFEKKEWAIANKEHYKSSLDWKPKQYMFAAVEHGKLCGTAHFIIQAGVLYVSKLIVGEKERRSGAGALLMKKIEDIAQKERAHKIYLHTGKNWIAAKFYRKLGYIKTGELRKHYGGVNFVTFTKYLGG